MALATMQLHGLIGESRLIPHSQQRGNVDDQIMLAVDRARLSKQRIGYRFGLACLCADMGGLRIGPRQILRQWANRGLPVGVNDLWRSAWCRQSHGRGQEFTPPIIVENEHSKRLFDDADPMFDQHIYKLIAVYEADVCLTGRLSFFTAASRKVASGDDDALLVHLQGARAG